jgi:Resolvase, N terminal domain
VQNQRICGTSAVRFPRGFNWDKLPSTAGSVPTTSPARARNVISVRSPGAGHHIVGVFKETASGAKNDRAERQKVMALAQAREIDAILVTELSR